MRTGGTLPGSVAGRRRTLHACSSACRTCPRDATVVVLDALADACGTALLDVHADPDHHRSVFTLGRRRDPSTPRARWLARRRRAPRSPARTTACTPASARSTSCRSSRSADDADREQARRRGARRSRPGRPTRSASRCSSTTTPTRRARTLPDTRARRVQVTPAPTSGPHAPHPTLGAVAVGARPPLVAVNCELATDDVASRAPHRPRRARARRRPARRARARASTSTASGGPRCR